MPLKYGRTEIYCISKDVEDREKQEKYKNGNVMIIKADFLAPQYEDGSIVKNPLHKPSNGELVSGTEYKLYKKRFWILFLYCMCAILNAMQWIQYSVITDVVMCYYEVSVFNVNWTTLVFMVVYIPLIFPASWFVNRYGLRIATLLGSFCIALSSIIQCFTLRPDAFAIVLLSQTVAAAAGIFLIALPPKVAAIWFGPNEVSRACAVGIFGGLVGIAIGFTFPPSIVPRACSDKFLIEEGMRLVAYTLVGCSTSTFFLSLATFDEKPPVPPSPAEANKTQDTTNLKTSIVKLVKNFNFIRHLLSFGIIIGIYSAFSTVLNQLVLSSFADSYSEVGWIGFIYILAGLVGLVSIGCVLDYTHKYKDASVAVFVAGLMSMILFTAIMQLRILWLQFFITGILGFFLTSYIIVGLELATEITYPESENTIAGVLNVSSMSFTIIITMASSELLQNFGSLACNGFLSGILLAGCIINISVKCDYLRQKQNELFNEKNKPLEAAK